MTLEALGRWFRSRNVQRWCIGVALLLVIGALRIPWLEADAGAPGLWSYGTFPTDEGSYTGGGRLAALTGKCYDPLMDYPSSLKVSPGLNFLSYISYRICGLTYAAARWPVVLAAMVGWLTVYYLASRVTVPWLAGVVTLVISCNPISLIYERWASSDVVCGVAVVVAYALLQQRAHGWSALAGVAMGFALLVKASAALLMPLLLFGLLLHKGQRLRRWAGFIGGCVGCYVAGQALLDWWVKAAVGKSVSGTLGAPTMSEYLTGGWLIMLRAISVFARYPISTQLGPFLPWLLVLPVWYLAITWYRTGKYLTRRGVVCAGIFVFLAALATQARNPMRYFVPALYFCPLLLVNCRALVFQSVQRGKVYGMILLVGTCVFLWAYWGRIHFTVEEARPYFYNEYVLPAKAHWWLSWPVLLIGAGFVALAVLSRLGWRGGGRRYAMVIILALVASCCLSQNRLYAGGGLREKFVMTQTLLQATVLGILMLIFGGRWCRGWRQWYGCWGSVFVAFALFNQHWSQAYPTLLTRRYVMRDVSDRIARELPPDALVVGRRVATLLRNTPLRLGQDGPIYDPSVFVEKAARLKKEIPGRSLYWVIGADEFGTYASPNHVEIRKRFKLKLVDTVRVPGDATPELVPLYVILLED